jgi:hypothetical protein
VALRGAFLWCSQVCLGAPPDQRAQRAHRILYGIMVSDRCRCAALVLPHRPTLAPTHTWGASAFYANLHLIRHGLRKLGANFIILVLDIQQFYMEN